MYCGNCGFQVLNQANFCSSCGHGLQHPVPAQEITNEDSDTLGAIRLDVESLARRIHPLLAQQGFFIYEINSKYWSNVYLQGATQPDGGALYLEIAGPNLTSPNMDANEVSKMMAIGWGLDSNDENFYQSLIFNGPADCQAIAELGLFSLVEVFALDPNNLDITFTLELD
jgi:hypothetical protein